ncbi:hypothetical protein IGL76_000590 [Enterococcus sp. DIV2381]|uniref:Uncharacterized protein n=1 Tax=Candidatus Enterococcus mangumiae TaxID=2230878 RepID=A0ABZ2SWU4_9ENTE
MIKDKHLAKLVVKVLWIYTTEQDGKKQPDFSGLTYFIYEFLIK